MALNSTIRAGIEKPSKIPLPSPESVPRSFGSHWDDPAFKATHSRPQALRNEQLGKIPPNYAKNYVRDHGEVPNFMESTLQLQGRLAQSRLNGTISQSATLKDAIADSTMTASLDDQVLRFFAYFVEECRESAVERRRTRKVSIKAFPSDNTFLVEEKRVANSGLQGGTLLKRQRVLAATDLSVPKQQQQQQYLTALQLNVGMDVEIFGIVYHIFACDDFTRRFLNEAGMDVGTNGPEPDDYYMTGYRAERIEGRKSAPTFESRDLSITMESLSSKGKSAASRYPEDLHRCRKFFEDNGRVAKFSAYWIDDEVDPNGRLRIFDVRCFIEDDTIAIAERRVEGAPSDAIAKSFLSRRRLPKSGSFAQAVAVTFAGRVNGQRDAVLSEGDSYYSMRDFVIGSRVNVFGREFTLYDCDPFTREYYYNEQGIAQPDPIDISARIPKQVTRPVIIPPPTGFGTADDSLASCRSLVLKPPRKDTSGWIQYGGEVLRFELQLLGTSGTRTGGVEEDATVGAGRTFVLTYYLEDDEIMISESTVRNSGFTGGKFLRKQRVRKAPGEGKESFYALNDLVAGNILDVHGFKFRVLRADAHTQTFLDSQQGGATASSSPTANDVAPDRLRYLVTAFKEFVTVRFTTITEAFRLFDKDKDGYICAAELADVLTTNQIARRPEEAAAVARVLDVRGNGRMSYADFVESLGRSVSAILQGSANSNNITPPDVAESANRAAASNHIRQKALLAVRGKLEARCMSNVEMFRLLAVLPRETQRKAASVTSAASLANGTKDTLLTPSQMRAGINSVLGLTLGEQEMTAVLTSFFPALPAEAAGTALESSTSVAITLSEFSARWVEVNALRQLPSS